MVWKKTSLLRDPREHLPARRDGGGWDQGRVGQVRCSHIRSDFPEGILAFPEGLHMSCCHLGCPAPSWPWLGMGSVTSSVGQPLDPAGFLKLRRRGSQPCRRLPESRIVDKHHRWKFFLLNLHWGQREGRSTAQWGVGLACGVGHKYLQMPRNDMCQGSDLVTCICITYMQVKVPFVLYLEQMSIIWDYTSIKSWSILSTLDWQWLPSSQLEVFRPLSTWDPLIGDGRDWPWDLV